MKKTKKERTKFYKGTAGDYARISAIVFSLLLVVFMNISLIFSVMSAQTEEIGRIQLDRIRGDLERTTADAERIVMRTAIGSEQLVNSGESFDKLEKYIIDQKNAQTDATDGTCTNIYSNCCRRTCAFVFRHLKTCGPICIWRHARIKFTQL